MADQKQVRILLSGVDKWNNWRQYNQQTAPSLSKPNLESANLGGVNLKGADLAFALRSNAYLPCANLSGADLAFALLSDACLRGANLSGVNLYRATLVKASLGREAQRQAADLTRAFEPSFPVVRVGIMLAESYQAENPESEFQRGRAGFRGGSETQAG